MIASTYESGQVDPLLQIADFTTADHGEREVGLRNKSAQALRAQRSR